MDIVTVTCQRDLSQMLLQAESIQKFVDPCRHWVIINDDLPDEDFWREQLTPFYTNHELILIKADVVRYPFHGYVRQQIYKFLICKNTSDKYLILDSKNFFIKPCSTQEWVDVKGCGMPENFFNNTSIWKDLFSSYNKYLSFNASQTQIAIQTPYVFDATLLKNKIRNFDVFIEWFANGNSMHSEFLFYSMLLEKYTGHKASRPRIKKSQILFPEAKVDVSSFLETVKSNPSIKIFGFHRTFLENQSALDKTYINEWIASLGLNQRLHLPF